MDKDLFVSRLKNLAPSREKLKQRNLSDESVARFVESYICLPKPNPSIFVYNSDALLSLVQSYDCSKVEIGAINFMKEPIETVNYYQIGNIDADILSINKVSLHVEVLDFTVPDHVIWPCADNSGKFLAAILESAAFFSGVIQDSDFVEDDQAVFERVIQCAEKAGGDAYMHFYEMLLGCFL